MTEFSPTDRDSYLWHLLNYAQNVIGKARKKELVRYNVSSRKSVVLFAVRAIGEEATPAKTSRWLSREPHSTSELLSRMEKEGLVRKVQDLDRKNMVRVVLTDKGRETYYQTRKLLTIHEIMSSLSEEECQQLWSSLQKLIDRAIKLLVEEYKITLPTPQWLVPFEHGHGMTSNKQSSRDRRSSADPIARETSS